MLPLPQHITNVTAQPAWAGLADLEGVGQKVSADDAAAMDADTGKLQAAAVLQISYYLATDWSLNRTKSSGRPEVRRPGLKTN